MKVRIFLCFFLCFLFCVKAQAETYADLTVLLTAAKDYLQQQVYQRLPETEHGSVKINSHMLDSRLKLKTCDNSLTYEHRPSSSLQGTVLVKILCDSIPSWSIYTKHQVRLEKKMFVSRRALPKNHILTHQDVDVVTRDIYTQRGGYITDKALLIGQQLKRALPLGKMIYHYHIRQPNLIKKGDRITVVAKKGLLSVITPGTALNSGRIGEQIKVENRRSSRIITAKVIDAKTVEVVL